MGGKLSKRKRQPEVEPNPSICWEPNYPVVNDELAFTFLHHPKTFKAQLHFEGSEEFHQVKSMFRVGDSHRGKILRVTTFASDGKVLAEIKLPRVELCFEPFPVTDESWVWVDNELPTKDTYSVLSWNILANCLVKPHSYPWMANPERHLMWNWRGRGLSQQIKQYNASVVCLQEVDVDMFTQFWLPIMSTMGYIGVRCDTTARYGESIFWKDDEFKLDKRTNVRFDDMVREFTNKLSDTDLAGVAGKMMKLGTDRHGLVVRLVSKKTGRVLTVATTHLWTSATRNSSFLRLLQLQKLLSAVHTIQNDPNLPSGTASSVVICGDFNADDQSPVYRFAREGKISTEAVDRDKWPVVCQPFEDIFVHPFGSTLNSALSAQTQPQFLQNQD